ncbi:vancomycin high temperature exclusion protein [Dactylosporangium sp. NPDC051541]|uniref:vancomycin high temperature exclusion protein n=1 Tax=Dactylosporangium sp. NPDC051541 TaxID=3363977 RepID=UPI00378C3126
MSTPPAVREEPKPPKALPWYRRRRTLLRLLLATIVIVAIVLAPTVWVRAVSSGRLVSVAEAPAADVAIVFGAEVAPGGQEPKTFLRNRLDTAAALVTTGKVKALLISGDAQGGSGNEVRVMSDYLARKGVEPSRVVMDPYGLDTYDTCKRAHDVYGVSRALLVSQDLHLYRAVTLCRGVNVDAWGVPSGCEGCRTVTIWKNQLRDVAAAWKAAWDATSDRAPAAQSPPDPSLQQAVAAHTP